MIPNKRYADGFQKEDGRLVKTNGYHHICTMLDVVAKNNLSKRKAVRELYTSRSTVGREMEGQGELYRRKFEDEIDF